MISLAFFPINVVHIKKTIVNALRLITNVR